MPGDRVDLPTATPHRRKLGGYDIPECPECHHRWRRVKGGKPNANPGRNREYAYLRACISVAVKQEVIDVAAAEAITISELVRRALRLWMSERAQGA